MTTSHEPIRSIAEVASAKFEGRNMSVRLGGAVHAVTYRWWYGEKLPVPACHVGTFRDTKDARSTWSPVDCGRAGCRELRGRTGRQAQTALALERARIRLKFTDGTSREVSALAALDNAAYCEVLYHIADARLRRLLAEYEDAHSLAVYAEQIAAQRMRALDEAQERGLLFDVA